MLTQVLNLVFGSKNDREIKALMPTVARINDLESGLTPLSDQALVDKTQEFKKRLADGQTLDDILPEAFAVCREMSRRRLNMRHFDVQLIGGMILHRGRISEMKTGEGKTLVATLPIYLNALEGKGVHLVTVNDYLAKRDAQWMAQLSCARTVGRHHPARCLVSLRSLLRGLGQAAAIVAALHQTGSLSRRHHLRHQQRIRVR